MAREDRPACAEVATKADGGIEIRRGCASGLPKPSRGGWSASRSARLEGVAAEFAHVDRVDRAGQ